MNKQWFTPQELASLPGFPNTDRRAREKCIREDYISRKCQTGKGFEYSLNSLPVETQAYIKAQQLTSTETPVAQQMLAKIESENAQDRNQKIKSKSEKMQQFMCLSKGKQEKAHARETAVIAFIEYIKPYSDAGNTIEGLKRFIQAYNSKLILEDSDARLHVEKVAKSSLYNWKLAYQKEGVWGLADKHRNTQQSKIDSQPRLKEFIHALVTSKPHYLKQATAVREMASIRADEYNWELPSLGSFKRWLTTYAKKHEVELSYITNPSQYTDKYRPLYARAYPQIDGPNQIWEFDSTPTDVELNVDGKLTRHSIVAAIDVYTRRVVIIVAPTSNSEAICLLLRKCLIDWGVPEPGSIMRTDNGSDYVSKRTTGIFNLLELEISKATAFSGWEKPFIERFFRTMSSTLMEKMVGYIGHSVQDRQQIEAMHTFAQRIGQGKKKVEQERLALALTPQELQQALNDYLEFDYSHKAHDKDKQTPFERYTNSRYQKRIVSNPHALDLLLSFLGTAKVIRGSVKAGGVQYTAPELQEVMWQRQEVKVFIDPTDVGRATLYPIDSWEDCVEAVNMDLVNKGISPAHFKEKRKTAQKDLAQLRKTAKKLQEEFGIDTLYADELAQKKAAYGGLVHFEHTTGHDNAAINGLTQGADQKQNQTSETELAAIENQRQAMAVRKERQAEQESRIVRSDHEKAEMLTTDSLTRELTDKEKNWVDTYRLNNVLQRARLDRILKKAEQSSTRKVK